MRVKLQGYTDTDAILVIECECGNTRMLDEAGDFVAEKTYVYRHGVPIKNLRCCPTEPATLKRISEGEPQCRERYRITLPSEHDRTYIEVAHLSPRSREAIVEKQTIQFPNAGSDDVSSA